MKRHNLFSRRFRRLFNLYVVPPLLAAFFAQGCAPDGRNVAALREAFVNPPDSSRPGVYWYFMDGNLSKEAMTKDLESMVEAGLGHLVYLEVNVGVPRGDVEFFSQQWKEFFKHAVNETERLGITIYLGVGPGWTGSGGPWVRPQESMQHLVSSDTAVSGPGGKRIALKTPRPKMPYFGMGSQTPEVHEEWEAFYEDVAVLAFPAREGNRIDNPDDKALYYRAPYTSVRGVKEYLPTAPAYPAREGDDPVDKSQIIDLTEKLQPDGTLEWDVPEGKWTVMRFGVRNNGAVTRPAPLPGVGMEADKFDTTAMNSHLDYFIGQLFDFIGPRDNSLQGGIKVLHMDSWEMGAQNWTAHFREEFARRRGYDPLPFYPVYAGVIVGDREVSERFLWDLRLTSQELVLENHAGHIREYAHRRGYGMSVEPYDMNPAADLELASVADYPMCEFWSVGMGYNSAWSAAEGASVAHLKGQPVVPAEAFTAAGDAWRQHPASMKDQSDWALAAGINRLMYHTFQHQPLPDGLRPGMTMGPYGVHWDRNQTWWYMADAYHRYITRCQFMLQQGRTVADILYLAPEGAPHVFRAPASALDTKVIEGASEWRDGKPFDLPDRRGYNFDACPPGMLYDASVSDGMVVFPSGARYRMLVLSVYETMTPGLLRKIKELADAGATIVGTPPSKSPSLAGYPDCDGEVGQLAAKIWGDGQAPGQATAIPVGLGRVFWSADLFTGADNLYPDYDYTAAILEADGIPEDFVASAKGKLRYTHRSAPDYEIYFVSNRTDEPVSGECLFRVTTGRPELWNPVTGEMRALPQYKIDGGYTHIHMEFESFESFFVVFPAKAGLKPSQESNFPGKVEAAELVNPWEVSFDPAWGGPANVTFERLDDWSINKDEGIKYYSGTAFYRQTFDLADAGGRLWLDLGKVRNMARVTLNGKEMGTVWTTPWRLEITDAAQQGANELTVEVVNLWPNRLIGDEHLPDDGIRDGRWPRWLLDGEARPGPRYTFTTWRHYTKDSPLHESGLLGPVRILKAE